MNGILKLRTIKKEERDPYIEDLIKYNGQEVTVIDEDAETYDVEMADSSKYTVYKDEIVH